MPHVWDKMFHKEREPGMEDTTTHTRALEKEGVYKQRDVSPSSSESSVELNKTRDPGAVATTSAMSGAMITSGGAASAHRNNTSPVTYVPAQVGPAQYAAVPAATAGTMLPAQTTTSAAGYSKGFEYQKTSTPMVQLHGKDRNPADNIYFRPKCDVVEGMQAHMIFIELAGVPKDGIRIDLKEHNLHIYGFAPDYRNRNEKVVIHERYIGHFSREFVLPENVMLEGIKTDYCNGLLTIYLPLKQAPPPQLMATVTVPVQPVTTYQQQLTYQPKTIYQPKTTYEAKTTYEPRTTMQATTTYQAVLPSQPIVLGQGQGQQGFVVQQGQQGMIGQQGLQQGIIGQQGLGGQSSTLGQASLGTQVMMGQQGMTGQQGIYNQGSLGQQGMIGQQGALGQQGLGGFGHQGALTNQQGAAPYATTENRRT